MFAVVPIESLHQRIILYSSAIGGILACIVVISLLLHLCWTYIHLFYKEKAEQNKCGYLLGISYLAIGLVQCLSYTVGRSNLFTFFDAEDFTVYQCQLSFGIFWYSATVHTVILELILLQRIRVIFDGSVYAYKGYIFVIYCIVMAICGSGFIAYWTIIMQSTQWSVLKDTATNIAYCRNDYVPHKQLVALGGTAHAAINIGLLYMFCKGLYALNCELIKQFASEHIPNTPTCSSPIPNEIERTSTVNFGIAVQHTKPPTEKAVSIEMVFDEYDTRSSSKQIHRTMSIKGDVKRILSLHNLIKKQCILVSIAIITYLLFLGGNAIWTSAVQEFGWDLMVNGVCVVLMYRASDKYWNCCKRYGFCQCCYIKTNQLEL